MFIKDRWTDFIRMRLYPWYDIMYKYMHDVTLRKLTMYTFKDSFFDNDTDYWYWSNNILMLEIKYFGFLLKSFKWNLFLMRLGLCFQDF